jgi:MFS family permease
LGTAVRPSAPRLARGGRNGQSGAMALRPALPRTVVALGLVSLTMDLSSEIIHALLPLFMVGTLGLSVAMVGLIDGIAESTASIVKVFSGWLSDRLGRRKPLILLGYGLAALSKPLFPLANAALPVLGARFADRIGKGIRGAPRDALIADVTPPAIRGRAFGLRQSMDTAGAFAGPLLAIGLMLAFDDDVRAVFWFAVVPAVAAVLLVLFAVDEPPADAGAPPRSPVRLAELKKLERGYWAVVGVGLLFTLARFSEAFLILKASACASRVSDGTWVRSRWSGVTATIAVGDDLQVGRGPESRPSARGRTSNNRSRADRCARRFAAGHNRGGPAARPERP